MHSQFEIAVMPANRAEFLFGCRPEAGQCATCHAPLPGAVPLGTQGRSDIYNNVLSHYLDGWAEANLGKIVNATAHEYRFEDPLVGQFSRGSFPDYFEHLKARFACAGAMAALDFAFFVRGPIDAPQPHRGRHFFREAPRLGLTGVTCITIGERGVIAENVSYDLNLASDVLRSRQ